MRADKNQGNSVSNGLAGAHRDQEGVRTMAGKQEDRKEHEEERGAGGGGGREGEEEHEETR